MFTPHELRFGCRCSRERVETMLRRFPEHELDDMRDDDGDVVVTCQFCNVDFRFDEAQLARLHGTACTERRMARDRRPRLARASSSGCSAACASDYETFEPPPLDFSDRPPLQPCGRARSRSTASIGPRARRPTSITRCRSPRGRRPAPLLEQRLRAAGGAGPSAGGDPRCLGRGGGARDQPPGVRGLSDHRSGGAARRALKVRIDRLDPRPVGGPLGQHGGHAHRGDSRRRRLCRAPADRLRPGARPGRRPGRRPDRERPRKASAR